MTTGRIQEAVERLRGMAYDRLVERVNAAIPHGHLRYSNFRTVQYDRGARALGDPEPEGDEWLVTCNLDEVAVEGRVRFVYLRHFHWGAKDWWSEVVEDPTWLDVCRLADEAIEVGGDQHHCYLEGVCTPVEWGLDEASQETLAKLDELSEDGVTLYVFEMGS